MTPEESWTYNGRNVLNTTVNMRKQIRIVKPIMTNLYASEVRGTEASILTRKKDFPFLYVFQHYPTHCLTFLLFFFLVYVLFIDSFIYLFIYFVFVSFISPASKNTFGWTITHSNRYQITAIPSADPTFAIRASAFRLRPPTFFSFWLLVLISVSIWAGSLPTNPND